MHNPLPLSTVFDGWDGYQISLVHAIQPLTGEQLAWRPAPHLRSAAEIIAHLAAGRIEWFARMPAPGSRELLARLDALGGERALIERALSEKADALAWLESSWQMIADTLQQWTTADLLRTYRHEYEGQVFAVSYQWTIWRILTHDIHHGGELALVLGQQQIELPELGDLFGHLTMPPLAE